MGKSVEHLEGISKIANIGDCTELDNTAHGIIVSGEAKADDLRVKLLELGHGRAGLKVAQR